jgi:hypothetical protein
MSHLILGKKVNKIANLPIKLDFWEILLHDFKENFNWEQAFYRPLLYKVKKITVRLYEIMDLQLGDF